MPLAFFVHMCYTYNSCRKATPLPRHRYRVRCLFAFISLKTRFKRNMMLTAQQLLYIKKCLMVAVFSIVFELGLPNLSLAAHENWVALANGEKMPYQNTILGPEPAVDSYEMIVSRFEKISPPDFGERHGFLPLEGEPSVVSEHWITVTAYSSEPHQTDSTPFTTAWQTPVRNGIVALNFLPKGTLVRFPDKFGDKIFIVEDRMNVRYRYRADIWMETRGEAKEFGIKYLRMEQLSAQVPRDYVLDRYEPAFPGMK